ncbi:b101 [miniopterid betaherpesvirus 1]|uniref:B101 n=1 Tax=miniopterid betaherpesvirus 1 TaxID=3070189 RepID=I3VQ94_9BETA|nr:b101 [miniopterid betaherpesvirus 1]AFK83938.1 b101 [miniopterid betaherpesvirus 1]
MSGKSSVCFASGMEVILDCNDGDQTVFFALTEDSSPRVISRNNLPSNRRFIVLAEEDPCGNDMSQGEPNEPFVEDVDGESECFNALDSYNALFDGQIEGFFDDYLNLEPDACVTRLDVEMYDLLTECGEDACVSACDRWADDRADSCGFQL